MGTALETIDKVMRDMRHDGRTIKYDDMQVLRAAIAREAIVHSPSISAQEWAAWSAAVIGAARTLRELQHIPSEAIDSMKAILAMAQHPSAGATAIPLPRGDMPRPTSAGAARAEDEWNRPYVEGRTARLSGAVNPYQPSTLNAVLHRHGWLVEDLRQALMRADPDGYGKSQLTLTQAAPSLMPWIPGEDNRARAWDEFTEVLIRMLPEGEGLTQAAETPIDAVKRLTREGMAARATVKGLGYTYHGAKQWKPPLGPAPKFDDTPTKPGWNLQLADWEELSNIGQWEHFKLMRDCLDKAAQRRALLRAALELVKNRATETRGLDFNLTTEDWAVVHKALDDKAEWTATATIRPSEPEFTGTVSGLPGGDFDVKLVAAPGVDLRQALGLDGNLELVLADRSSEADITIAASGFGLDLGFIMGNSDDLAPVMVAPNWEVDRQPSKQETVIACLGDDAAQIRDAANAMNGGEFIAVEWADNMDAAAELLAYEPLSLLEVQHLTTMLHGAPCDAKTIEHVHALFELAEKVRGMNKRPVDVAVMPPGYWDDEPGRPKEASAKFPFPTNIVIQPETGAA